MPSSLGSGNPKQHTSWGFAQFPRAPPKRGAGAGMGVGTLRVGGFPYLTRKISKFLCFLVSWFLGYKVPRFQSFLVTWFLGFKVSEFLSFEVSKIKVSNSKDSKIQKHVISCGRYWSHITNFSFHVFWNILISYSRFQGILRRLQICLARVFPNIFKIPISEK